VVQYTSNEVKQSVTGDGSAPKMQVQRMVQSLLSLPQLPDPPDVADALALALCHLSQSSWLTKVKVAASARSGEQERADERAWPERPVAEGDMSGRQT